MKLHIIPFTPFLLSPRFCKRPLDKAELKKVVYLLFLTLAMKKQLLPLFVLNGTLHNSESKRQETPGNIEEVKAKLKQRVSNYKEESEESHNKLQKSLIEVLYPKK